MPTKNTLNDIHFAIQYVNFLSRRAQGKETRARASILLATIQMLDIQHPSWREELIAQLARLNIDRPVEKLLPLPIPDEDKLYSEFIDTVIGSSDATDPPNAA